MRRSVAVIGILLAACGAEHGPERLLLGTTHTLDDSGILDTLAAAFSNAHPEHTLSTVVGSSGEILTMARRGDFDVVFTHSPEDEEQFIADGAGTERRHVMHNDFVIAGPPGDTAQAKLATDAPDAVRRVHAANARFVSRGDDSGTHRKERQIWMAAGIEPQWPGYIEAATGMADALRLASQRRAYILADRATFETLRAQLELDIVCEGDPRLINTYSVTLVTAARNMVGARAFAAWLTDSSAQRIIANFGRDRTGRALFIPDAS